MAHNFQKDGPLSMYNKQGEYRTCYNDPEVVLAKNDGFTSARYIKSTWPAIAWNRTTGAETMVKSPAALALLGEDWTLEYTEKPKAAVEAPTRASNDALVSAVLNELSDIKARLLAIESEQETQAGARAAADSRLTELEGLLTEATK